MRLVDLQKILKDNHCDNEFVISSRLSRKMPNVLAFPYLITEF